MKNFILVIFIFFIVPLKVKSQDTLMLKDGRKVECKILEIDSLNVYIEMYKNYDKIKTFITKESVEDIKYKKKIKQIKCISISVGKTISTGNFASDDIQSDSSGLGGNGLGLNSMLKFYIVKKLGILIKCYYNTSEFKADKISNYYSSTSGMTVSNNSVKYSSFGFLLGPTVLFPVDRLSINGHILFGHGNLTQPGVNFIITSVSSSGWIKMSEIKSKAYLFNIGGGLIFTINKNWNLIANIDYLRGKFQFDKYKISDSTGQSQYAKSRTQKYSLYTLSIGLELKF